MRQGRELPRTGQRAGELGRLPKSKLQGHGTPSRQLASLDITAAEILQCALEQPRVPRPGRGAQTARNLDPRATARQKAPSPRGAPKDWLCFRCQRRYRRHGSRYCFFCWRAVTSGQERLERRVL